jgi:hypothetical protein
MRSIESPIIEPAPEIEMAEIGQSGRRDEAMEFQAPDEITPAPVYAELQPKIPVESSDAPNAESSTQNDEPRIEDRAEEPAAESEEAREKNES